MLTLSYYPLNTMYLIRYRIYFLIYLSKYIQYTCYEIGNSILLNKLWRLLYG